MPSTQFDFKDAAEFAEKWTPSAPTKLQITVSGLKLVAGKESLTKTYQDSFSSPSEYSFDTDKMEIISSKLKLKKDWRNKEIFYFDCDSLTEAQYSRYNGVLTPTYYGTSLGAPKFGSASIFVPGGGVLGYVQFNSLNNAKFGLNGKRGAIGFWLYTDNNDYGTDREVINITGVSGASRIRIFIAGTSSPDKIGFWFYNRSGLYAAQGTANINIASSSWIRVYLIWNANTGSIKLYQGTTLVSNLSVTPFDRDDSDCTTINIGNHLVGKEGNYLIDDITFYDPELTGYDIDPLVLPTYPTQQIYPYDPNPGTPTLENIILRNPDAPFSDSVPLGIALFEDFRETATKPAYTTIMYLLSNDNGLTWRYWTGSAWITFVSGAWNIGSEVQTGIPSFPIDSTDITWKIVLYTADPLATPELDINEIDFKALIYWDDNPYIALKSGYFIDYQNFISAERTSVEPTGTNIECQISTTKGNYWLRWNGTSFEIATTLWGSLEDTLSNIDNLPQGDFLIKIRLLTTEEFETPIIELLNFNYIEPYPNEPVITTQLNEAIALYDFNNSYGYTFNESEIFFDEAESEIKLIDQGGGVYPSSSDIILPILLPTIVTRWLRIKIESTLPTGTDLKVYVQFSNDAGELGWGAIEPDLNDGEYWLFNPDSNVDTALLRDAHVPRMSGKDAIKIKLVLEGSSDTPIISKLEITYWTYSEQYEKKYDLIFTDAEFTATLGKIDPQIITNAHLFAGEQWVLDHLAAEGIDGTEYAGNETLKLAASMATLGYLAKVDQSAVPGSGTISSTGADGMSISYGSPEHSDRAKRYSGTSWHEEAGQKIDLFIQIFRGGKNTALRSIPKARKGNQLGRTDVWPWYTWGYRR